MSGMNKDTKAVIRRILSDIRVELGDEFDRNFERQAFFSDAWARRKSPTRPGGTILVDTGTLRRSVKSRTTDDSITFYTDLPYAAIHNDGGEIVVTEKMKRFFWHKYYEATGSFGRKKNGERRNDKRTRQLSTEADFWRFMALKRAGTTIRIPKRRFLGTGPEVERIVREIIEDNLNEYFNMDFSIERK
jgi:phage gpG-like protein